MKQFATVLYEDVEPGIVRIRMNRPEVRNAQDESPLMMAALRGHLDPVFLPRRLRCVNALPRNDTGKLPRAELLRLLDRTAD